MAFEHGDVRGYTQYGCRCSLCYGAAREHRLRGLPEGDPRHGTVNGYNNCGCRCTECRVANSRYMANQRLIRFRRGLAPGDPRHGTDNGYGNYGCRCAPCTCAHARDQSVTNARRREREESA